jgi:hypothetical protein
MILDLTFVPEPVSYEEHDRIWSKLTGSPQLPEDHGTVTNIGVGLKESS